MSAHNTLNTLWDNNGALPEAALFRFPAGQIISYREAFHLADKFRSVFEDLGLNPGDRVACVLDKSHYVVILYIACVRSGVVFCPINAASTRPEIEYFVERTQPSLVVSRYVSVELVSSADWDAPVLTLDADGSGSLIERARPVSPASRTPSLPAGADPAAIMYTSGTTGRPKAALMTQENLATNAASLCDAWQFQCNDVLMHALPIHHTHGLFVAMNVVLATGASVLFLPRFDADEVSQYLPQCTVMMGVPTFYTRLLANGKFTPEATANIRLFVSGSAPLPTGAHEEFEKRTGHRIMERYGMTEVGIMTSNRLSEPHVRGTVGIPLSGVELRLTESLDSGVARVEVRGPGVFGGYWTADEQERDRKDFTSDGFFVTGDLGRFDANGHLVLIGREKDIVITGGLNVYPKEVETEIRLIDGVEEAAVVGVPHNDFGEAVVAFIVVQPSSQLNEEAVKLKLRSRLAGYKQPKMVISLKELPRNAMGKVDSKILRNNYAKLFA